MRRLLPALLIAAALGAGAWWFAPAALGGLFGAEASPAANAARLRTAPADRGPIASVVTATGTVNPLLLVQVGSSISGQIREMNADFNSRVTAGQQIARLDTATIEARRAAAVADLAAAQAAVAVARAGAEKTEADTAQARAARDAARAAVAGSEAATRDAESDANRTADLRRGGVGAVRDAERAAFAAERARATLAQTRAQAAEAEAKVAGAAAAARTAVAQVEAAEAAAAQKAALLRQVEVDLNNAIIRSPIDGVVVSRNVDLGQTVAASFQAPVLFTIAASLDEMQVWATVDEADIGRVSPGQEATFTVAAHPGETLRGRVKEIRLAAATVSNVVTYTVVVTAPNAGGRLLPGMTATLRVVTDAREDALRVPNAALRWRPAGTGASDAANGPGTPPGGGPLEQAIAALPDVTPAQREELEAIRAEFRERMAALPADGDARRAASGTARQRLLARMNTVLTAEQRARLAELRSARGSASGTAPGTVYVLDPAAPDALPRPVALRVGLTDGNVTEVVSGDLPPGARLVVGAERAANGSSPAPSQSSRRLF